MVVSVGITPGVVQFVAPLLQEFGGDGIVEAKANGLDFSRSVEMGLVAS